MGVSSRHYKYLFGPVPSRRLGLSLGVDILPSKTCSLDCIYCESGQTTNLTIERKPYVNPELVIEELETYLSTAPKLDFITFSGCGEPTLNSGIKDIIAFLKVRFPLYKVALLTNSTLFYREDVRKDLLDIDLVVASIDAVSTKVFNEINRPEETLETAKIIKGLELFRKDFESELWIEIFVVPEINDNKEEISLIRQAVQGIRPDNIQLNSLDRPGTESWVPPADNDCLQRFRHLLDFGELIRKDTTLNLTAGTRGNLQEAVLNMIKRRPCTIDDIATSLGISVKKVDGILAVLGSNDLILKDEMERGSFYKLKK